MRGRFGFRAGRQRWRPALRVSGGPRATGPLVPPRRWAVRLSLGAESNGRMRGRRGHNMEGSHMNRHDEKGAVPCGARPTPKFNLGPLVATPGALEALERNKSNGLEYLARHARGDWGDLCDEDKQSNDAALQTGARLLSAYRLGDGTKIWIITDAEIDDKHSRQATTILLPDEY